MGLLLGCALIGLAEWTRSRKWNDYAHAVAGGGVGVIYLSAWVAFHLYGLLSPGAAFTALLATSMLGVGLSLRHDSQPLSFLAVLGAYVAPSLIGDAEGDASALYLFVLAVDVAVLTLAALRHWTWLTKLAFTASWFLFGLSISTGEVVSGSFRHDDLRDLRNCPAAAQGAPRCRALPARLPADRDERPRLLPDDADGGVGPSEHALFTASMVGVYAALGTGSHLAFPQHRGVAGLHGALAIFFITIWGHLALSGQAVISYWALEALVLFVLASVTPIREFRAPGGVVLGMAAMGVLFRAGSGYEGGSLVNAESAAFASVIAVMAGVWWLLRRDGDEDPVWGRMLTISAHVLTVVWLTVVTEAYLSGPSSRPTRSGWSHLPSPPCGPSTPQRS